jgi:hypothetical protein
LRDHLQDYHYLDDATFEGIKRYEQQYNQRVSNFIEITNTMIRLDISTLIPSIEEYTLMLHPHSNYYFFNKLLSFLGEILA